MVSIRRPYDSTASYDLRSLYDFEIWKRKTVARRRVVGSIVPCDDRAVAARIFMIILGQNLYGDRRETAKAQSEIIGTPHGHRTRGLRTIST